MNSILKFINSKGLNAKVVKEIKGEVADVLYLDAEESITKLNAILTDMSYKFGYTDIDVYPDPKERAIRLEMYKADVDYIPNPPMGEYGKLNIALGMGVTGTIWHNFDKQPHMLIAGMSGSGKTRFLKHVINSIVRTAGYVQLVPLDYKGSELNDYVDAVIPLLTTSLFTLERVRANTIYILNKIVDEMKRRATLKGCCPLFVIVDEVGELMDGVSGEDKETITTSLRRIAQLGRSAGVHLIMCTQNPVAAVVDPGIKRNLSRISFRVADNAGSRVILDASGAELLSTGSFYYMDDCGKKVYGKAFKADEHDETVLKLIAEQKIVFEVRDDVAIGVKEPPAPTPVNVKPNLIVLVDEEHERKRNSIGKLIAGDRLLTTDKDEDLKLQWDIMGPMARTKCLLRAYTKED